MLWDGSAVCGGHSAESRAQWVLNNDASVHCIEDARERIMCEFPNAFAWQATDSILSQSELEWFDTHGFLVLRNAVPTSAVNRALRAIYAHLGAHGAEPSLLQQYNAQSWVPQLAAESVATASLLEVLRHVQPAVRSLVGRSVPQCAIPQVALRFPQPLADASQPAGCGREPVLPHELWHGMHIDGLATADNAVQPGSLHSFSLLAGCALTDQMVENAGNLVVLPGSHVQMSHVLRSQAQAGVPLGPSEESELWGLGQYVPAECTEWGSTPLQLRLSAGDVVLCHYLLAHTVAPNLAPTPRANLYWRVAHADHAAPASLVDPRKDFDSLHGRVG